MRRQRSTSSLTFCLLLESPPILLYSADEKGGSRYKSPGSCGPEWGPDPEHAEYVFVFVRSIFRSYELTLSYQTQNSLQLKVSLSDLV